MHRLNGELRSGDTPSDAGYGRAAAVPGKLHVHARRGVETAGQRIAGTQRKRGEADMAAQAMDGRVALGMPVRVKAEQRRLRAIQRDAGQQLGDAVVAALKLDGMARAEHVEGNVPALPLNSPGIEDAQGPQIDPVLYKPVG